MLKDVLPTLTKLSVFFQKDNVGLASVEPMVKSTIATIQTLRNDLQGELANLPSLKELNQQVLTSIVKKNFNRQVLMQGKSLLMLAKHS